MPAGGNLLLPVDESVPGSGLGPALPGAAGDKYTQNRATIHLHGNNTVWISDGNTHQWITPASETTPYPAGVSARNVPDMGTGLRRQSGGSRASRRRGAKKSSGCMTFFYTNAQSARLQFYHDHAHGITRLNVYAGEAAGYVVTDAVEQDMIAAPTDRRNPGPRVLPGLGIPLVIQDRTFVDADDDLRPGPDVGLGIRGAGDPRHGRLLVPARLHAGHESVGSRPERTPSAAGSMGPGSTPPPRRASTGGPVGCIEVGPVPNPYHQADCDLVPPGPAALRPGSRR